MRERSEQFDHEPDWTPDTGHDASAAPGTLHLDLEITDADVVAALSQAPEGRARNELTRTALRIGVLALNQAQGQIDADTVRREGERLITSLAGELSRHREQVTGELAQRLQEYFDPSSGRFNERIERLLKKDGELETLLRRQMGSEDSDLARTLTAHVGSASPLMQKLDPNASDGLLQTLRTQVEKALHEDSERIIGQFSLDDEASALSRLVARISDSNGELSKALQENVQQVVKEFSLDSEDSALSRLVRQVDSAQKKISAEFSLDSESSALARIQSELLKVLKQHSDTNTQFQQEVRAEPAEMKARREESQRSTTHGNDFEMELFGLIQRRAQTAGDVAQHCGNTTGEIRNCKKGDMLIELGPEQLAAGSRIVIEAKQHAGYDLAGARAEIAEARKNRTAQIGVFVFSRRTAPEGLEPLARYGNDIVVLWDAEDEQADVWLDAALSLARALCSRDAAERDERTADFVAIERAIREIEKQANGLGDITRLTQTIESNAGKVLDKIRIMTGKLQRQISELDSGIEDLKGSLE